ncbi:MAG: mannitol dehydrogenase family protein [Actinomycetaceae bacterium]|nr:mannitol dehydrogenase family protein [Actinomycetaceae bacterium]
MKLSISDLKNPSDVGAVEFPCFDVAAMQKAGRERPRWLHIGPGNLFRVFPARVAHDIVSAGEHWPVTAVVPLNPAEADIQLTAHDLMTLSVTLNTDGTRDQRVIAGISEVLATARAEDFQRFIEVGKQASVTMLSMTITEKGYAIHTSGGELSEAVKEAIASNPRAHQGHTMALVATMLLHRFEAGGAPITLLSFDNFSHNGDKLRDSVLTIAKGWKAAGSVGADFVTWLSDDTCVAFPVSVIDKITPRPNACIAADLAAAGWEDMQIDTSLRTPLAGFVNTEAPEYLLIEDRFAAERAPLEDHGVAIVPRQVCDDFERMKVTTCLNPLHTALAVSGCLLRKPTIDACMADDSLRKMVQRLGWDEAMPVVVNPGVVDPKDFLREVLEKRFPNRYLPDDPARIAMDTSQKIPIRFGETIKSYLDQGRDLNDLQVIALIFALWARYLKGTADDGEPLELSPDPLAEELAAHLQADDPHEALRPLLSNPAIFGVNLYETPLAARVEELYARMLQGPGAVRATIDEEMNNK